MAVRGDTKAFHRLSTAVRKKRLDDGLKHYSDFVGFKWHAVRALGEIGDTSVVEILNN